MLSLLSSRSLPVPRQQEANERSRRAAKYGSASIGNVAYGLNRAYLSCSTAWSAQIVWVGEARREYFAATYLSRHLIRFEHAFSQWPIYHFVAIVVSLRFCFCCNLLRACYIDLVRSSTLCPVRVYHATGMANFGCSDIIKGIEAAHAIYQIAFTYENRAGE